MGAEITTIGAAWSRFRGKRAPQLIAVAVAAAVILRVVVGALSWRDAAAAAAMVVIYPFGEWAIHVHLLHLPPVRGRRAAHGARASRCTTSSRRGWTSSTSRRSRRSRSLCAAVPVAVRRSRSRSAGRRR